MGNIYRFSDIQRKNKIYLKLNGKNQGVGSITFKFFFPSYIDRETPLLSELNIA